jgi:hypothetical protein
MARFICVFVVNAPVSELHPKLCPRRYLIGIRAGVAVKALSWDWMGWGHAALAEQVPNDLFSLADKPCRLRRVFGLQLAANELAHHLDRLITSRTDTAKRI